MNPSNNTNFCASEHQQYRQNTNFNIQNSLIENTKSSHPLLPYHEYINKNKTNSNIRPQANTLQSYYNSNYSYQNSKYSSPSYPNYYAAGNGYTYNSNNLPTYQQFKKQNQIHQSGSQKVVTTPEYNKQKQSNITVNKQYSKDRDQRQKNNYIKTSVQKMSGFSAQKQSLYQQKRHREPLNKKMVKQYQDDLALSLPLSDQSLSEESENQQDEEVFYQKIYTKQKDLTKTKSIYKKKDPVLDSPEQIKKWIEMRKKNYPRKITINQQSKRQDMLNDDQKKQMSKLQSKIRKKIQIINGDTRNLLKKLRNIDILRRIVSDPKALQKNKKKQQKKKSELKKHIIRSRQIARQPINVQLQEESASIQPVQQPVRKLQQQGGILQLKGQIVNSQIQKKTTKTYSQPNYKDKRQNRQIQIQKNNFLFQYNEQKTEKSKQSITQYQIPVRKDFQRSGQPEQIISHLQEKQKQDKQWLNTLFDYKANSHSYKYKIQTLQVNFKLQEIFQQTSHLLQAIRYIIKQNFFEDK